MPKSKRIVSLLLALACMFVLSGCEDKIWYASPDPSAQITAKPGESLTFMTIGPTPAPHYVGPMHVSSTAYFWPCSYISDIISDEGLPQNVSYINMGGQQIFTYTVPEDVPVDTITVACYYVLTDPGDGDALLDSCEWTINIDRTVD